MNWYTNKIRRCILRVHLFVYNWIFQAILENYSRDDLLFFIEADLRDELTPDKKQQESFIQKQIVELSKLERETPLTESELKREKLLVQEFVDLYNYYHQMFGGFKQFYNILYQEGIKAIDNNTGNC